MTNWISIEDTHFDNPIWVLTYDMYATPAGNYCDANHPEAIKYTDIHGWYKSEEDAMMVYRNFTKPNTYRVKKAYQKTVKEPIKIMHLLAK